MKVKMNYFYKIQIYKSSSLRRIFFLTGLTLIIIQLPGCMIGSFNGDYHIKENHDFEVNFSDIQLTLDPMKLNNIKIETYLVLAPWIYSDKKSIHSLINDFENTLTKASQNIEIVNGQLFLDAMPPDGDRKLNRLFEPDIRKLIAHMDVDYLVIILPYKRDVFVIGPWFLLVGIVTGYDEAEFSTIVIGLKNEVEKNRFDLKTGGGAFIASTLILMVGAGKNASYYLEENIDEMGRYIVNKITNTDNSEPIKVVVMGGVIKKRITEPELHSD